MTKVYPNSLILGSPAPEVDACAEPAALTVWRKSLLFNCSGFTVFDAKGSLVFRVDNYSSESRTEIVLMDAAGKPLFAIRRKRLSLADHWQIYEGEGAAPAARPSFSMRKHATLFSSKALARVIPCSRAAGEAGPIYSVEGSFSQRACVVYDERRRPVAEVQRKEAVAGVSFGGDVFRLVVQPDFDAGLAMAVVILLEQMFGSRAAPLKG
ncbi:Protein LURP-one-related 8 [Apostasia shenzhenica]|uniref:Protein LURP-one-related 8 n=1 Tax=Apostasia shenzhenica TaxID=1088818 RepID=A0A2I0A8E7_9ASPA|nr:Protein LURP-one-related 8 [Apostasia shenzhenica]